MSPQARPGRPSETMTPTVTSIEGLSTAASLGEWVRAQVDNGQHEPDHTTRVITRETDRGGRRRSPT